MCGDAFFESCLRPGSALFPCAHIFIGMQLAVGQYSLCETRLFTLGVRMHLRIFLLSCWSTHLHSTYKYNVRLQSIYTAVNRWRCEYIVCIRFVDCLCTYVCNEFFTCTSRCDSSTIKIKLAFFRLVGVHVVINNMELLLFDSWNML